MQVEHTPKEVQVAQVVEQVMQVTPDWFSPAVLSELIEKLHEAKLQLLHTNETCLKHPATGESTGQLTLFAFWVERLAVDMQPLPL